MRLICFILSALAIGAGAARAGSYGDGIHDFELENGLRGVVIEDHRAPVVTSMIWYRVGSADSPPGQSGIAHFLEHLMFRGTDELEDGEFSRVVAENGGNDNAFTSADYTAYFQEISADRLDLVLAMEADRMVDLDPGERDVLAERDVVMEERRQVVESSPDAVFSEYRDAIIYLNHPYRRPVIGWEHEIAAFDEEKATDFYKRYYAPNNAILVVAGDVTPEEVEELARKHFGPIPANPAIGPRMRPQEPVQRAARRVSYRDARVRNETLSRHYLAPQRQPSDQKGAASCEMLAEVLGGGVTSVMGRDLELGENAIAVSSGASYLGTRLDPGMFSLYVVPRSGIGLEEAEARLDDLIARFIAEGPDADQLARIKRQVAASEIYARDGLSGRANRFGRALATGLSIEDALSWPGLLQEVTAQDVTNCARAVFRPESSVTALLLKDGRGGEGPGDAREAAETGEDTQ